MSNYRYESRDSGGQVVAGVIQASSVMEATNLIRSQGQYLLTIVPVGAANAAARMRGINIELGPSLKDILAFTSQLAVMIKAGINIREAIEGIARQIENARFQRII